ncbi:hypothetical protein A584_28846 [Pseudomonas syringae pv. theae ICMP 3923]|uniref:Uncharacterized protein n=1 Tax=Pseudomonas syringae pv. theae TaxID=103985 RepID=A0A3M5M849_PSESX|nr:hypothetical protein [Pseudomonas syringae]EPM65109.1 hypothetical protein A584_28846 [Pseudomonas syringae pv. theae ICMP 3923]RMT55712.1 hypothetical protein ALP44_200017 [Pseudomonas syringae pv. theae]BBI47269.1 hypothetical protein KPSA1B_300017 [Pseudomonas syringae pv. actinidiae]
MSWADAAAPIVAQVIRQVGRTDMRVLRKALADAYPWGARENAPYKAWLAEIRRQLGHPLNAPKADPANRQLDLFNHVKNPAQSSRFRIQAEDKELR